MGISTDIDIELNNFAVNLFHKTFYVKLNKASYAKDNYVLR